MRRVRVHYKKLVQLDRGYEFGTATFVLQQFEIIE